MGGTSPDNVTLIFLYLFDVCAKKWCQPTGVKDMSAAKRLAQGKGKIEREGVCLRVGSGKSQIMIRKC
jgi:hypothetical protein